MSQEFNMGEPDSRARAIQSVPVFPQSPITTPPKGVEPSSENIKHLLADSNLPSIIKATRLSRGHSHFVYDLVFEDQSEGILKVSSPSRGYMLAGSLYWQEFVGSRIPTAKVLFADVEGSKGLPFILFSRLPGIDLIDAISQFSRTELLILAGEVSSGINRLRDMPEGPGYGGVLSHKDSGCFSTWLEWVDSKMAEASGNRHWDPTLNESFDWLIAKQAEFQQYFLDISKTPFLEDLTLRNIIVKEKRLSGVVDLDELCFGDPLAAIGSTQAELIGIGADTEYSRYLAGFQVPDWRKEILDFYTVLRASCLARSEASLTTNSSVRLKEWLNNFCK